MLDVLALTIIGFIVLCLLGLLVTLCIKVPLIGITLSVLGLFCWALNRINDRDLL